MILALYLALRGAKKRKRGGLLTFSLHDSAYCLHNQEPSFTNPAPQYKTILSFSESDFQFDKCISHPLTLIGRRLSAYRLLGLLYGFSQRTLTFETSLIAKELLWQKKERAWGENGSSFNPLKALYTYRLTDS